MQETGRRGAPSLFCPFATHRTVHRARLRTVCQALLRTVRRARLRTASQALLRTACQALLRTACQALLRTAWQPPAPAHRHRPHHRRTAACAAPVSSASSPLTARRPHFRPHLQSTPPSASSSAARHQPAAFPTSPSPVPAAARRLFSDLPVCVSHTSRNKCMHICSTC